MRRARAVEKGCGEAQLEIGRDIHIEAHTARKGAPAIEILPADDDILHKAVAAPVPVEHNAAPNILAKRDINHSLHARLVIVGVACEQIAFIFVGRCLGDEIDRAAIGVATV